MTEAKKTVFLLALCQALAMTISPIIILIASLIGVKLANNSSLATLPVATMVVGTALGTVPMALLMRQLGRKVVFIGAVSVCSLMTYLLTIALKLEHFVLFCIFTGLIGFSLAGLQQIRFAAIEAMGVEKAATATSIILIGGVIAAFLGPELAILGKDSTDIEFEGSFRLAALCLLTVALLLFFYKPKTVEQSKQSGQARKLTDICRQPGLWLAIGSASIGFALMSYIMTATPISMHHHNQHNLVDTKWVIQTHIAAMFLPSLFVPILVKYISLNRLILTGLVLYALCISIALNGVALMHYWWALLLLGIGWNFMFIGGTSLLPNHYKANESYKVQAFNDASVFSCQAIASISAGWVLNLWSWHTLLYSCVPFMLILPALMVWVKHSSKSQE
ncbi:MFS transporter [Catenovulum sp. SM1970]|uniref:MFS transporter n=1 Tax=Marinifaba aquimaris TaxID=2741323 RepID=UPI001573BBE0|nr:MFS transporter [Marinifaba aquimaris]NTS76486.1 MFS transporter [Marinifaba aquimaris]